MNSILIIICILLTVVNAFLFRELTSLKAICMNNFNLYNENLSEDRKFMEEQDGYNKSILKQVKNHDKCNEIFIGLLNEHTEIIDNINKMLNCNMEQEKTLNETGVYNHETTPCMDGEIVHKVGVAIIPGRINIGGHAEYCDMIYSVKPCSFGVEQETYRSVSRKISYLFAAIQDCGVKHGLVEEAMRYFLKVRDYVMNNHISLALPKYGVEDGKFIVPSWNKCSWVSIDRESCVKFLDFVTKDDETFLSFIFNPESYIQTGAQIDISNVEVEEIGLSIGDKPMSV